MLAPFERIESALVTPTLLLTAAQVGTISVAVTTMEAKTMTPPTIL
jgi:hypothetical protein